MKFLGFAGIMIAAVICGYLTARFIIAPLLGYDTEVLKLDFPSKLTSLLDKDDSGSSAQQDDEEGQEGDAEETGSETESEQNGESGYALQFGLFADKDRAEKLVSRLKQDGIEAQIREIDGKYKVISDVTDTKDQAVEKLKETETDVVSDVFITVI